MTGNIDRLTIGQRAATLRQAQQALRINPKNQRANLDSGLILLDSGDVEAGLKHLKRALAGDKKNPHLLLVIADALLKARRPADARKYARRLLELRRRDPDSHRLLANVCEALDQPAQAITHLDNAMRMGGDTVKLLDQKANLQSAAGDIDAAIDTRRRILELRPGHPYSLWVLAQQQQYDETETPKLLEAVERSMEGEDRQAELRGLNYAAGKLRHDMGEIDRSFEHYQAANKLHSMPVTAQRILTAAINLKETYSPALFEAKAGAGDDQSGPVFILGMTRSGTTLVESICAAHSKVAPGGELAILQDMDNELAVYSQVPRGHAEQIAGLSGERIAALVRDYRHKTRSMQGSAPYLTDKLPHNFFHIGLISLMFPKAKIVHCRRRPLDNCLSIFTNPMLDYHKEYKSDLATLGVYYRQYAQLMDFWKEVSPVPIHDVFYEDLVTNTEHVSRGLIDFLDLEWEDGVLDRTGSQKAVKTLSVWQVRQPVYRSSSGRWRQFEAHLGPLIEAIGPHVERYERELADLDQQAGES